MAAPGVGRRHMSTAHRQASPCSSVPPTHIVPDGEYHEHQDQQDQLARSSREPRWSVEDHEERLSTPMPAA